MFLYCDYRAAFVFYVAFRRREYVCRTYGDAHGRVVPRANYCC
nr:MAG TPA: hypothetical protein [Caudoviricetes sp.]